MFVSFPIAYASHRFLVPPVSTMETRSQQPKGRDGAISSLNAAIEAMNLAKEDSSITPAKAVFGSVSVLLTMIKVRSLSRDEVPRVNVYLGLHDQRT